ncbi:hypothetical protein TWF506_008327 [Arthrobotrys conoides]|uniref:Uncharacterized protein n=1 Tax=Arthrobotrys conoides TaxID=74498 RepID=A0AAN8N951_9PEZI
MKPYSYTPIADLLVDLIDTKQQQHSFLVSSAALRVASPVWRKMLDPDTKFAPLETVSVNGKEYIKITIEGVEVESLQTILGILHYSTENIFPRWMSRSVGMTPEFLRFDFSVIRGIALLLDQYDCVAVISHFAEGWFGTGKGKKEWPWDPDYVGVGFEDWIFIASVFSRLERECGGCSRAIQLVSRELIKDICMDSSESADIEEAKHYRWKETQLTLRDAGMDIGTNSVEPIETREREGEKFDLVEVDLEMIPQKILGFILDTRLSIGYQVLAPLYYFIQKLMNSETTATPVLLDNDDTGFCENTECSAIALGTLIQSLREQGLQYLLAQDLTKDELRPPSRCSLQDLTLKIQVLQMTTFQIRNVHTKMKSSDIDESIKNAVATKPRLTAELLEFKAVRPTLSYTNRPIFLRTDQDISNPQSAAVCPLVLRLSKIKTNAQDLLNSVKGYENLDE